MNIEGFKKILPNMTDEELYEMLKEVSLNKTESMSESRVKKVRERAKSKNTSTFFKSLSDEEKKQLIESLKNEAS